MGKACLSVALALVAGCRWGQHPEIDVTAAIENGQAVFNISSGEIAGIDGFKVEERGKQLWAVALLANANWDGHKIVYGVVPPPAPYIGGDIVPKQTFPSASQAPADIRGKTVTVCIEYSYCGRSLDARFTGSFEKTIDVPQGGEQDKSHKAK